LYVTQHVQEIHGVALYDVTQHVQGIHGVALYDVIQHVQELHGVALYDVTQHVDAVSCLNISIPVYTDDLHFFFGNDLGLIVCMCTPYIQACSLKVRYQYP